MNKHNQNGSAHVFILISVFFVIIAGVGFLFWKNFIDKPTATTEKTDMSTVKKEEFKTAGTDSKFAVPITWKYPSNWSMQTEGSATKDEGGHATQKITLTSPSKKYSVNFSSYINFPGGGACDPNGDDKIQYINKKPTEAFSKAAFSELAYTSFDPETNTPNGYQYESGLRANNAKFLSVKAGDSMCSLGYSDLMVLDESTEDREYFAGHVKFNDILSDQYGNNTPADLSTIKKHYEDQEYKQAVSILLSISEKK